MLRLAQTRRYAVRPRESFNSRRRGIAHVAIVASMVGMQRPEPESARPSVRPGRSAPAFRAGARPFMVKSGLASPQPTRTDHEQPGTEDPAETVRAVVFDVVTPPTWPNTRRCALHDHQAVGYGIWSACSASSTGTSGHGPRERVLPMLIRSRCSRRRPTRSRAFPARVRCRDGRARQVVGGAALSASDERGDHLFVVREVGQLLARLPIKITSGRTRPLGDASAPVPAYAGVPLAGRPHRDEYARRGAGPRSDDARRHARFAEETLAIPVIRGVKSAAERFSGRGRHVLHRGDDAGRQSAAGRHVDDPDRTSRRRTASSSRAAT